MMNLKIPDNLVASRKKTIMDNWLISSTNSSDKRKKIDVSQPIKLSVSAVVIDFTSDINSLTDKKPVGRPPVSTIKEKLIPNNSLLDGEKSHVVVLDESGHYGQLKCENNKHYNWSQGLTLLCRSLAHKWALDGSHYGWSKPDQVIDFLHQIDEKIPEKTIRNKLSNEKKNFENRHPDALTVKPNTEEMFNEFISKKQQDNEISRTLGQYKLQSIYYPELSKRINKFIGHPGFGARHVQVCASLTFKNYNSHLEEKDWIPSIQWCYSYLKNVMNLRLRRITGKATKGGLSEKQTKLWNILLDQLAIDVSEGVLPEFIIGSDEFGVQFFPVSDYTFAVVGSRHVTSQIWDDKRQFTGNIIHNASGEFITLQVVYGGKSSRSLPTVQPNILSNWIVGYSQNHWSNLTEKIRFVDKIVEWRNKKVEDYIRTHRLPPLAKQVCPMVLLLDCWSVNMSADFKTYVSENYPFIRIRYIPAGLTGKYQINDTYFHGPYKKWLQQEANQWYTGKVHDLIVKTELESTNPDYITLEKFDNSIHELMSLPNLRNLSVGWMDKANKKLVENNLILKGWSDMETYGQIFLPEFQNHAISRKALRDNEEWEKNLTTEYEEVANSHDIDDEMPDINRTIRKKNMKQVKTKEKKLKEITKRITIEQINEQTVNSLNHINNSLNSNSTSTSKISSPTNDDTSESSNENQFNTTELDVDELVNSNCNIVGSEDNFDDEVEEKYDVIDDCASDEDDDNLAVSMADFFKKRNIKKAKLSNARSQRLLNRRK